MPSRCASLRPKTALAIRLLLAGLAGTALLAQPLPAQPHAARSLFAPLSDGVEIDPGPVDEAVVTPREALGHALGERFTRYSEAVRYLTDLAETSPRLTLERYGETYEGRPLVLLVASSPANLERLGEIRRDQRSLADPGSLSPEEKGALLARAPAVVWLAYGVHGNESSSTEAAVAAAYLLAAGRGEMEEILGETVVLLDPLVNPDGRERYVHSYQQRRGREPDPHAEAAEHAEPWPGGRFNHYGLDLNRDWAWLSQVETRHRLAAYREWEPHVYVDFHEMSSDSTYFFPPSAAPILPHIDERTVSWLERFGRANAAAFDEKGWLYFNAESYDLFYPGYGDSYPALRGAVGMTYEMAGGGRAGLALALADGRRLALADRAARHLTTTLATLRAAAHHRSHLLEDFLAVRDAARAAPGRAFVWEAAQPEARAMAELLRGHGVAVQQLAEAMELRGTSVADGELARRAFGAGSYAASTTQPLGRLLTVLVEREAAMPAAFLEEQRARVERNLHAEFYDVTAWSLPLAFGVETWEVPATALPAASLRPTAPPAAGLEQGAALGWLLPPGGLAGYRVAAALQGAGILHRVATEELRLGERVFPPGTLFVPRGGNPTDVGSRLDRWCAGAGLVAHPVASGFSREGTSLGSDRVVPVRAASVGLLQGEGISPTAFGALWHLLDEHVRAPHSRLDTGRLGSLDLDAFDVLILPDGDPSRSLTAEAGEKLGEWVRSGGLLIATGEALDWTRKQGWSGEEKDEEAEGEAEAGDEDPAGGHRLEIAGAAVATELSPEHPLGMGLAAAPAVMVSGRRFFEPSGDPRRDVLTARREDPILAGFAWPEAQERLAGSVLVTVDSVGSGRIVGFAHDPAFRLFWRSTMPLVLNAALYGPSLKAAGLL